MKIEKNKVVSIEYTLKDSEGEVLDTTDGVGPLDYIHGQQNLIPGLEVALEGKEPGNSISVTVPPKDAYGDHVPELVMDIPRGNFPPDIQIEVGMQFEAAGPTGMHTVTVVDVKDENTITIDANHPLAGETLHFDVTIADVRDATEQELANGLWSGGCGGCGGGSCSNGGNCGNGGCGGCGDGDCGNGGCGGC